MPKKKSETINEGLEFSPSEFFFSITDSRGIILSGNDVFVRISEYSLPELIGANHNIIRHPDMPRVVFKLLWDTIKAGHPISAYVKNCAKSGRFYWVVANVYPLGDRFLSVRFKPTTPLRGAVEGVYASMLEAEKSGGMEASGALLMDVLAKLGFSSYAAFQNHMLYTELQSLDSLSRPTSQFRDGDRSDLAELVEYCDSTCEEYRRLFSLLGGLRELASQMTTQSAFLLSLSSDTRMHSINSCMSATRLGNEGRMLGAVSNALRSAIVENDATLRRAKDNATACLDEINVATASICASRILIQMLPQFARRLLAAYDDPQNSSARKELRANMHFLMELLDSFANSSLQVIPSLNDGLLKHSKLVSEIERFTQTLEIVRAVGVIELSRVTRQEEFQSVFNQLDLASRETRDKMQSFTLVRDGALNDLEKCQSLIDQLNVRRHRMTQVAALLQSE